MRKPVLLGAAPPTVIDTSVSFTDSRVPRGPGAGSLLSVQAPAVPMIGDLGGFHVVPGRAHPSVPGRRVRPGPEADFVDRFLGTFPGPRSPRLRVTVFREPKLATGFPDLVFVRWCGETAAARGAGPVLPHHQLQLVHFLATHGPADEAELRRYNFRLDGLAQLATLGYVSEARGRWRLAPLRELFAVRSIVAFEAKMSNWASAIEQAALNCWFASESYVLVPRVTEGSVLLDGARARGVGVWVEGATRPVLRALRNAARQPVSYASWLFNEWVRTSRPTASEVEEVT